MNGCVFSVLMGYLHLLWDWKEKYSPKTPDEPLDDRFVEACQMESRIEYLCDIFITGDTGERAAVLRELLDTDRIAELKEYTERKYKEERRIEQRRKTKLRSRRLTRACPHGLTGSTSMKCYFARSF